MLGPVIKTFVMIFLIGNMHQTLKCATCFYYWAKSHALELVM